MPPFKRPFSTKIQQHMVIKYSRIQICQNIWNMNINEGFLGNWKSGSLGFWYLFLVSNGWSICTMMGIISENGFGNNRDQWKSSNTFTESHDRVSCRIVLSMGHKEWWRFTQLNDVFLGHDDPRNKSANTRAS